MMATTIIWFDRILASSIHDWGTPFTQDSIFGLPAIILGIVMIYGILLKIIYSFKKTYSCPQILIRKHWQIKLPESRLLFMQLSRMKLKPQFKFQFSTEGNSDFNHIVKFFLLLRQPPR